MKFNLRFLFIALFICTISIAQNKGTISGVLTDKEMNNDPLPFANVLIKGTNISVNTDVDGKYSLNVNPGNYTLIFSFLGYESVEAPVAVKANETVVVNQALSSGSYTLKDVVVQAAPVSKQKESALLLDQKNAVSFKAAIGAEEISRKGVNDVANAVAKVSGVSKQDDSGNVFVRGLGDRYNVTTLNGLPLPSNNPANKNILLDIFSTNIVDNIGISKTFEAQNYADFGGANIDIAAKRFSGKPFVTVSIGSGANTNVLGQDNFYLQDGPTYMGFKKVGPPDAPLQPYNYSTSWDRQTSKNVLNAFYTLSGGKRFNINDESSIGTFITGSFSAKNKYTKGFSRGGITSDGDIFSDFVRTAYKHSTTTTVMGTADYKINNKNSIFFTSLFLNSSDQDYSEYEGTNQNFDGGGDAMQQITGFIKRGTFERTQLIVNQLTGKNKFNDQWNLNWGVGYSMSNSAVPDRMQNSFVYAPNAIDYTFFTNSNINNHRFYQDLKENEIAANIALSYNFKKGSDDTYKGKLTVGYSGKFKDVDYNMEQYSFFPNRTTISFPKEDIHHVDNYLDPAHWGSSYSNRINQIYNGNLDINAGFVNLQYSLTERLSVILGARLEQLTQNVFYITTTVPGGDNSNDSKFNILPSLISKYTLNDKQNLKFSASKTYTLPQFKEKVPIIYEDVAQAYEGNPNLYASTNYNFDLGWEFFPKAGELVSVTAFGKIIQNPINEMFLNSSSNDISYANTGDKGTVAGVEVEFRKDIFEIEKNDNLKTKLSFDANGSYLYTKQDLSNDKVNDENDFGANFTFTESKLTGASNFLANANLSFLNEFSENKDISATLSYSYFSDKLAVIGTSRVGNMVDKAVNKLDFIVNTSLTKSLKLGLIYNNILNPTFERVQEQGKVPGKESVGDITVTSYKAGSDLRLTLNYTF
ncbi:outer membrane receptor protein involved in Fe transport [Flavobacterium nitrogenifigens]|uniref:Outer membrane receptor protein involved in Fe transport n=2 Tax=Flavobacterium TaxID=237 RepID=A0A7W7IW47_9FLAO|nr:MULTISPECIES: TonB-dependent receptor [Flavobacterium]MBB4801267.1 outer membrane receptor protein involved in Fe transport [Flavobacterium nitrogenifigens]MBB6384985.1 outer membrane receptor protein involved in Fe transport [Flavobacterium notoginsengisoli]